MTSSSRYLVAVPNFFPSVCCNLVRACFLPTGDADSELCVWCPLLLMRASLYDSLSNAFSVVTPCVSVCRKGLSKRQGSTNLSYVTNEKISKCATASSNLADVWLVLYLSQLFLLSLLFLSQSLKSVLVVFLFSVNVKLGTFRRLSVMHCKTCNTSLAYYPCRIQSVSQFCGNRP